MMTSHTPRDIQTANGPAIRRADKRSGWAALAVGLGLLGALSATAYAARKVTVNLEGDIALECGVTGFGQSGSTIGAALDIDDISKPGHKIFNLNVNCNAPFEYRLEAQHGALTHESAADAPRGFLAQVPYRVAVHIPTDAGVINDRCSGESIRAGAVHCRFSDSGNGIALDSSGRLMVAWAPDGIPLAGKYSDRLTITVGARQ